MPRGGARKGAGRKPGQVAPAKKALQKSIEEMARKHAPTALRTLVEIASSATQPAAARVAASNSLLDRGFGKPVQALKHSGDEDAPLNLGVVFVGSNPNDLIPKEEDHEASEGGDDGEA